LRRLGTDYLDCYLLHWRGTPPLAETMGALEQLVDEGKIRSLGVSNFDVADLEEAQKYLKKHKIACNQVLYKLQERTIERRVIPFCKQHEIAVVGYTPLRKRPLPGSTTAGGKVLADIARKHEATLEQIILAFLVRDDAFTVVKATDVAHVRNNAAADIHLTPNDITRLDQAFPAPKKDKPLPML
jgi:diketogulonate reductase-like aldo/keto reductase